MAASLLNEWLSHRLRPQVVTTHGFKKDATWIADLHERMAADLLKSIAPEEYSTEDLDRDMAEKILGVVLDNPRANRNALEMLEARHTTWICLGCQAHALSLLVKDLANPDKCPELAKLLEQVLGISRILGDSSNIRGALVSPLAVPCLSCSPCIPKTSMQPMQPHDVYSCSPCSPMQPMLCIQAAHEAPCMSCNLSSPF
jgi:hypothetical protein